MRRVPFATGLVGMVVHLAESFRPLGLLTIKGRITRFS